MHDAGCSLAAPAAIYENTSGGAKGATTHWFNARDGIRVRYGKIQCMTSEHNTKFVELTLLQDQRAPVEDRVRL
eukprot:COSAG03_NODE_486_length_7531_cov_49.515608_8_plen_74_part_00